MSQLDVNELCYELHDFVAEGQWNQFIAYMAERGHTEADINKVMKPVTISTGRTWFDE